MAASMRAAKSIQKQGLLKLLKPSVTITAQIFNSICWLFKIIGEYFFECFHLIRLVREA